MTAEPGSALPPPGPARPTSLGHDADLIASAVMSCPLVAGLHPGPYGEVATYLPGRRIPGIRVGTDAVEIHVIAHLAASMSQVAGHIRAAVAPWVAGRPVDVVIEDLWVPGDKPDPRPPADAASAGRPPRPDAPTDTAGAPGTSSEISNGDETGPAAVVPAHGGSSAGATVTVEVGNADAASTTVITIDPTTPSTGGRLDRRHARPEHEEHSR